MYGAYILLNDFTYHFLGSIASRNLDVKCTSPDSTSLCHRRTHYVVKGANFACSTNYAYECLVDLGYLIWGFQKTSVKL